MAKKSSGRNNVATGFDQPFVFQPDVLGSRVSELAIWARQTRCKGIVEEYVFSLNVLGAIKEHEQH